jgi:hypothetical protein
LESLKTIVPVIGSGLSLARLICPGDIGTRIRFPGTDRDQRPATIVAAEPRERKRRDVDMPKRSRLCFERADNGGANYRGVSNSHDHPRRVFLRLQPTRNPRDQRGNRFPAVRSCFGISKPFRHGFGIPRLHILERAAGPFSVVAIPQGHLDSRIEPQSLSGFTSPQSRARKTSVALAQAMRKGSQLLPSLRVERFIGRKRGSSDRGCRRVAKQC